MRLQVDSANSDVIGVFGMPKIGGTPGRLVADVIPQLTRHAHVTWLEEANSLGKECGRFRLVQCMAIQTN